MIRRLALLALIVCGGRAGAQEPIVRLDVAGTGPGPELLARALAEPHSVVAPAASAYRITRATELRRPVIVLGRDVIVEGRVRGDVIVVAGDLYMHPGGAVSGSAVAIGGGVYESSLATVGGPVRAFRDFTYDVAPVPGGYALAYRSLEAPSKAGFALPRFVGLSIPTYDRTDGLSAGLAPGYAAGRATLTPSLIYRSQLGRIDPSLGLELAVDPRTTVTAWAGRDTRSNERWIHSDLVNSADFLALGDDARNYYRSTRADLRASRRIESASTVFVPWVGAAVERAHGVRPGPDATGGPWTVTEREDPQRHDRLRLNPPIDDGAVASILGGAGWTWNVAGVVGDLRLDGEVGRFAPTATALASTTFAQMTADGGVSFPTFGTQFVQISGHMVATGGTAPRQRWAYLGGAGSLPTIDLLAEGGDHLVFVDGTYQVPIDAVQLPLVGPPTIGLREVLGGAKAGGFPTLHQAIGLRLSLGPVFAEALYDPSTRRGHTGLGLSLSR